MKFYQNSGIEDNNNFFGGDIGKDSIKNCSTIAPRFELINVPLVIDTLSYTDFSFSNAIYRII